MNILTASIQASEWWAARIRARDGLAARTPDTAVANAFLANARAGVSFPSGEQITRFKIELQREILAFLSDKHWDIENPRFGDGLRVIYVDWSPCPQIEEACKLSGISTLLLPMKTNMWIHPDGIRVKQGREIVTLGDDDNELSTV